MSKNFQLKLLSEIPVNLSSYQRFVYVCVQLYTCVYTNPPQVICEFCNNCRDLDLCRDPYILMDETSDR